MITRSTSNSGPCRQIAVVLTVALHGAIPASTLLAEQRKIDTAHSVVTVRAYKSGVFSAFGHNHVIAAPIAGGTIDTDAKRVELVVNASALRVRDPEASDKDRREIEATMLGTEVLDANHYPDITFQSTSAESTGPGSWRVQGNLTLHGQTHPVTVDVRNEGERFVGSARLKQTEFGIKPVKVAGGTVKVKDELRIDFDIKLSR